VLAVSAVNSAFSPVVNFSKSSFARIAAALVI